ncbi:arabinofuranosyltransferase [Actinomadura sp. HBU206391]|uniref:arabinofuranosyltransferase n=1 Tax=Actinomadura sp. HBU206391 TaxID=2731692 RepID=UPI00164EEC81|nr:arabinofuranosyltransferase [Actinomadura sp. HBU206391]MBC6458745.1 arabinofuranosyltransferase [Actinomadura sp. HBU206391]
MQRAGVEVHDESATSAAPDAEKSERRRSWRSWRPGLTTLGHPSVVAVLVWLVAAPLAALVPSVLDVNPFTQAGADVPLVLGGFAVAAIAGLALWKRSPVVIGVAAGLFAAWTVLLLRTAWHGTPFPAEGLYGDTGRLAAMATRYTVTSASTDGLVEGVASEYPPLYPWLIGKTAVLLDIEAWRLLAPAAILVVSASIVVGFALWSRLTSPGAALAITALGLAVFGKPVKAYEVIALAIIIPLLLLTAGSPDRGRLHWLPAGLIGGLMALTYYAYLAFAVLGVLTLVWLTWRAESDRRAYVLYLGRIVAVMLVVTSWYLIPYVWAMLHGGQQVADMFQSSLISMNPLLFLEMTPLGIAQLVGLAGLLWLRRSVWWAPPLLAVVLGTYAYYLISLARYVATSHTGLFYYAFPVISAALLAAAVLTVLHVVPALVRHFSAPSPAGTGVAVMSIVLVFAGYTYWHTNMPSVLWYSTPTGGGRPDFGAGAKSNRDAAYAHNQAFPGGSRPRFAGAAARAENRPWFPVEPIQRAVESTLGPGARPSTLSYDEQLFAFLPWRGYMGVERIASYGPVRWDDRYAEVTRLSKITDPAAFAQASANTKFGPIDVFVLHREKTGLVWRARQVPTMPTFQAQQFDPRTFVVVDGLPADTVVAVRRP